MKLRRARREEKHEWSEPIQTNRNRLILLSDKRLKAGFKKEEHVSICQQNQTDIQQSCMRNTQVLYLMSAFGAETWKVIHNQHDSQWKASLEPWWHFYDPQKTASHFVHTHQLPRQENHFLYKYTYICKNNHTAFRNLAPATSADHTNSI